MCNSVKVLFHIVRGRVQIYGQLSKLRGLDQAYAFLDRNYIGTNTRTVIVTRSPNRRYTSISLELRAQMVEKV